MKIDSEKYNGFTIEIHTDEDCSSPRENDNLGTIIGWHRNYALSDKSAPKLDTPADFDPKAYAVCLPIYMMEHGGVSLSTGDYGDRWDSGQVGWIFATADDELSADMRAKVVAVLTSEVEEYGHYLNGECYGYVIKNEEGQEIEDGSCWGFIGTEDVRQEARQVVDQEVADRLARADALTDLQRSEN